MSILDALIKQVVYDSPVLNSSFRLVPKLSPEDIGPELLGNSPIINFIRHFGPHNLHRHVRQISPHVDPPNVELTLRAKQSARVLNCTVKLRNVVWSAARSSLDGRRLWQQQRAERRDYGAGTDLRGRHSVEDHGMASRDRAAAAQEVVRSRPASKALAA